MKNPITNDSKRKFYFLVGFSTYTKLIFMYMALIFLIVVGDNMISKNLGVLETLCSKEYFYSISAIPSLVMISTIFLVFLRSIYKLKDIYYGIICGINELGTSNIKKLKTLCFIFALFSLLIVLIVKEMPHDLLNKGIYITHFIIIIVLILTPSILHYTSIYASERSYTAYDLIYLILLAVLSIIFIITVNISWVLFFSTEIYTMGPNEYNGSIAEVLGSTSYQPSQMFMSSGQNGNPPVSLGNQSNVSPTTISGTNQGNVSHTSIGGRSQGNISDTSMGGTRQNNLPHSSTGRTSQGNTRGYWVHTRRPYDTSTYNFPPPRPYPTLQELSDSFERNVWGFVTREVNTHGYPPPVGYPPNPYLPLLQQYATDPNFDPRAPFNTDNISNFSPFSGQVITSQQNPIENIHNITGDSGPSHDTTGGSRQIYDPIRDTHNATDGSGQLTGNSTGNANSNTNVTSTTNTNVGNTSS